MRRNDKKAGSKGILLGILFIVTMVVTFLSMGLETVIPSATTMTELFQLWLCLQVMEQNLIHCMAIL